MNSNIQVFYKLRTFCYLFLKSQTRKIQIVQSDHVSLTKNFDIKNKMIQLETSTEIIFLIRILDFPKKNAEIQDYLEAGPSILMSSFSSLTSLIQIVSFLSSNILWKK